MTEKNLQNKRVHNFVMQNREKLMISAITDVDSFDETIIVLYTDYGQLTLKGEGLHINHLSVEAGDIEIEGLIHAMAYSDTVSNKGSFLSKLFR